LNPRFWSDKWCGDLTLCIKFPQYFSLTIYKDATIRDVVVPEGDQKSWNFEWRRSLFQWEEEKVSQLLAALEDVRLTNLEDRWHWKLDPDFG
jgi:hypothetical protein